jgi:hypothetical protein
MYSGPTSKVIEHLVLEKMLTTFSRYRPSTTH